MEVVVPTRRPGRGLLAIRILLILMAVIVVVLVIVNGGTNVSYRASMANMKPINPAEVIVNVQVTNTGSDFGTPACTVYVRSPGGAYASDGVQTAHQPIPGSQTTLHGALPSPLKALTM